MFTFPLSKWVGGIRYEHFHRLVASTVGFLTIILAVWTWRAEPRRWVRALGWACLGAVVLQGLLGGLTVLLKLPPAVSIGHAGLAQIFFCLTTTMALVTSRGWRANTSPVHDPTLSWLTAGLTVLVYTQILLGATMRHTNAGMAIPTFPLAFGHIVPPFWNAGIAIHFAHRVGAGVVTIFVLAAVGHVRPLARPAHRRAFLGRRDARPERRPRQEHRVAHPERFEDFLPRELVQRLAAHATHDVAEEDVVDVAVDEALAGARRRDFLHAP